MEISVGTIVYLHLQPSPGETSLGTPYCLIPAGAAARVYVYEPQVSEEDYNVGVQLLESIPLMRGHLSGFMVRENLEISLTPPPEMLPGLWDSVTDLMRAEMV